MPASAVHPAASSPVEDGELWPGFRKRSVPQSEGVAQQRGTTLSPKRSEEDQPHHLHHLHTQDIWKDVCQYASGRVFENAQAVKWIRTCWVNRQWHDSWTDAVSSGGEHRKRYLVRGGWERVEQVNRSHDDTGFLQWNSGIFQHFAQMISRTNRICPRLKENASVTPVSLKKGSVEVCESCPPGQSEEQEQTDGRMKTRNLSRLFHRPKGSWCGITWVGSVTEWEVTTAECNVWRYQTLTGTFCQWTQTPFPSISDWVQCCCFVVADIFKMTSSNVKLWTSVFGIWFESYNW